MCWRIWQLFGESWLKVTKSWGVMRENLIRENTVCCKLCLHFTMHIDNIFRCFCESVTFVVY